MIKILFLSIPLLITHAYAQPKFIGDVYLKDNKKDGIHFRLLKPIKYVDQYGETWTTPTGYETDGASIPRVAWTAVGSPFTGKYLRSAIIHDYACDKKEKDWKKVHRTFYEAMLVDGVPLQQAKIMYAAVYHKGPRWEIKKVCSSMTISGGWLGPFELPLPCKLSNGNPALSGSIHNVIKGDNINVNIEYKDEAVDLKYSQPTDQKVNELENSIKQADLSIDEIENFKF
ncbi:DUF1353 domain-containing protein [Acinetobacter modestus]|uniref:DUF1353 domain-containing protein n=1 Tax=Acinetobacter modestus TaxID=1776740 RepID=UPI001F4AE8B0|nr:DUF1353 domain-containing protein [Acinetobacter modestus]MCH7329551.1 DUF1353 domain-containing protein [Acinetobacter modestus]